ncbi:1-acyl-sn-glycerol-3-phosphate acyltransferase [Pleomorphovibrio marinus]|uniref:1-acyl-sn-glycerol-3-phosphate acyltransferase n=1 Tax=Pleomorphovibrio marinus TaxID=2164132 RepID=UPI000E0AE378|nr:1-acyl-sn-glycerol-3-phosphate acyltransferase [Pleomorphovibrio marinus]
MPDFDSIRPFYDSEVNYALREIVDHPMMEAIMGFTFPDVPEEKWKEQLLRTHSIRDFQVNFIYHAVQKVLEKSSHGITTSGFEHLSKNTAYLFISNHRDIILDTSFLNTMLYEHGCLMTTSAIGDNLVKKPFLKSLSKLTRNFTVYRNLTSRAMLESSMLNSAYIKKSILNENRSVWIAQREGRTKDGNDMTQRGVLKMVSLACDNGDYKNYFKQLKIVPVAISYENDPTDVLKMPELMAKSRAEIYVKEKNEDFKTLLSGIMGQKKRIHLALGKPLQEEVDEIFGQDGGLKRHLQLLGEEIDRAILSNYKLWPANYVAMDLMSGNEEFSNHYSPADKEEFIRRLEGGVDKEDPIAVRNFLAMYANPVANKQKLISVK